MAKEQVYWQHNSIEAATSKKFVGDKHSYGTSGYKEGQVSVQKPSSSADTEADAAETDKPANSSAHFGAEFWILSYLFMAIMGIAAVWA